MKKIGMAVMIAIGGACASQAFADNIYRWVDNQGVTHFGARPPAATKTETVQVRNPAPRSASSVPSANTVKAPEPATAPDEAAKNDMSRQEKAMAAELKKNCEAMRSNLQILKNNPRIKEVGQDGEVRILDDKEKQTRQKEAEAFIDEHCK